MTVLVDPASSFTCFLGMCSLIPDNWTWKCRIDLIPSKNFHGYPKPQKYLNLKHEKFYNTKISRSTVPLYRADQGSFCLHPHTQASTALVSPCFSFFTFLYDLFLLFSICHSNLQCSLVYACSSGFRSSDDCKLTMYFHYLLQSVSTFIAQWIPQTLNEYLKNCQWIFYHMTSHKPTSVPNGPGYIRTAAVEFIVGDD